MLHDSLPSPGTCAIHYVAHSRRETWEQGREGVEGEREKAKTKQIYGLHRQGHTV